MHRGSRVWAAVAVVVALAAGHRDARAGGDDNRIVIGTVESLHSRVLDEDRPLLVHLPSGYGVTSDRYPVLYLLDGKYNFDHVAGMVRDLGDTGAIPRMIVIGIANTDRTRDFTPTHLERDAFGLEVPTSGGADQFQKFLEQELVPWVDQHYRTAPYRILSGHCLTGMFVLRVLLSHSDRFDAYFAVSPYLGWDDAVALRDIDAVLARSVSKRSRMRFLITTYATDWISKRYGIDRDVATLERALRHSAPARLSWRVTQMFGEDHDTINHASIYRGLKELFRDHKPARELDLAGLEKHYRGLGKRYGYVIGVPEMTVNLMGYRELAKKNVDEAVAIFERNAELHPASANVYDSLGEAYEVAGDPARALAAYREAITRLSRAAAPDQRVLGIYREHVARAERALAAGKVEKGKRSRGKRGKSGQTAGR